MVIAEVVEVVMCAAGFVPGHAAETAVDRLAREATVGCSHFGDDVATRERGGASALVQPVDGVEDGVSAAWTSVD